MSVAVQLPRLGTTLTVEPGQTILEAALVAGIPYPHGCRAGNCGACKSRLLAGETDLIPYSEYALTDGERAEGLILACRATPWEDCSVAWLESDEVVVHPVIRLPFAVTEVTPVATDTVRVRLTARDATEWIYSPGQYAEFRFGDLPARSFSMANPPPPEHHLGPATIELHIRLLPGGRVGDFVRDQLRPGDIVEARGPFGSGYLRARHTGPLLLVAGGTGLAPLLSIAGSALRERADRPVHLYIGARDASYLYARDELAALAQAHPHLRIVTALSETATPDARSGFVHEVLAEDLRAGLVPLDGAKAYLAGPPPMVDAARATLTGFGLPAADLHADAFYTSAEQAQLATPTATPAIEGQT